MRPAPELGAQLGTSHRHATCFAPGARNCGERGQFIVPQAPLGHSRLRQRSASVTQAHAAFWRPATSSVLRPPTLAMGAAFGSQSPPGTCGLPAPLPPPTSTIPSAISSWRCLSSVTPSWQPPAHRRGPAVAAGLAGFSLPEMPALLPLQGPWGVWTGLVLAGAFGLWSERTRLGKELSGALVSTLAGMFLANVGLLPPGAPELHVVYRYLLPLAIPMLLFAANLRRILSETGRLLAAFLLGSAATLGGSLIAMAVFPLGRFLGEEGWKVASALTARHIGGAVNYMAVSEALSLSPSTFGAGLAADDLILTVYFVTIYYLARNIPPDAGAQATGGGGGGHGDGGSGGGRVIKVPEGLTALSISALVCYVSVRAASAWGMPGQAITIITATTVLLATALPRLLAPLVPSAEGLAQLLMQIFYATIGASANVGLVVQTAPVLFLFSFIALGAHLGLLLLAGRLTGFSMRELLLASNANIGGPSTVAGMAAAKGWRSSVVPGILTSTLGYAIGTFLGMGLGYSYLRNIG